MTLESDLKTFLDAYEKLWDHEPCTEISRLIFLESTKMGQILKQIKDSDRCCKCGNLISGEEQTTIRQKEEFWGALCYQEIVTGYICSYCNHKEMF